METWYFYIWAITIFVLSGIHLYKANLGCVGFILLLLWQLILIFPSFQYSSHRMINGLEFAAVIYTQGFLTFLLVVNAILEYFFKSFKYKGISIVLLLMIPIAAWSLLLLNF